MNKILSFFVLILLYSCNDISSGTHHNEAIDTAVQKRIELLNNQLIEGLNKGSTEMVDRMLSDDINNDSMHLEGFVEQLQEVLTGKAYLVVDQFHVVNNGSQEKVAIVSQTDSARSYSIHYQANTKESYVSLLEPSTEGDKYRILAIYGKFDNQWRLNILQYGRHTVANDDAIAHYALAKKFKAQGFLTKAINHMVLASAISTPAKDFFSYTLQSEMDEFNDSLMQTALEVYPMPMTIDQVATKPEIFKIMPQRVEDHICTMIKYKTSINLADTIALKAENDILHALVPQVFEGIGRNVPYVFYRAYNQIPDEHISVPFYGFVQPSTAVNLSPTP